MTLKQVGSAPGPQVVRRLVELVRRRREMTSIELKPGDRVHLNELGASRSPKIKVRTGVVIAFSGNRSGGASLGILFDGNKRPTTLHRSYVELDEEAKGE